jgi:hypothetical protein
VFEVGIVSLVLQPDTNIAAKAKTTIAIKDDLLSIEVASCLELSPKILTQSVEQS